MIKRLIIFLVSAVGCLGGVKDSLPTHYLVEVNPASIKMHSADGLESPLWFKETWNLKNFTNCSFFNSTWAIPPYKDSTRVVPKNPKRWSVFSVSKLGVPFIGDSIDLNNSLFLVAGFPVLVKNKKGMKVKRSKFSTRRCPRTIVGITDKNSVIIYLPIKSDLFEARDFLLSIGCTNAINLDGGGSTFLYLHGKKMVISKKGRKYPNVISWSE